MTQRDLVLHLLEEAGSHGLTTNDFLSARGVGSRFSARILELRKEGFEIASQRIRTGSYRYRLVSSEEQDEAQRELDRLSEKFGSQAA